MKQWFVSVQLNGEEESKFYDVSFDVSEKLYSKMQHAIKKGIPLVDCSFFSEIEDKANKEAVKYINNELRTDAYGSYPEREEYECKEDYLEAIEEYNLSDSIDNYCIEEFRIYDPGYFTKFKNKFLGRTSLNYAKGIKTKEEFEFEVLDEICATYYVTVIFDENGTVIDITDVSGEAMESEDVKGCTYESCEPDYTYIEECLEIELFDMFE